MGQKKGVSGWRTNLSQRFQWDFRSARVIFALGLGLGALGFSLIQWGVHEIRMRNQLSQSSGQAFYAMGQYYARRWENLRLSPSESHLITQGIMDWSLGKKERVKYDRANLRLNEMLETREANQKAVAEEAGKAYLRAFAKKGGFITLSGLGYRIHGEGKGKKPTLKNRVVVSYRGTRLDGTVVDGTTDRSPRAELPMNGVIPGWSEGLQLIAEGGEIELVVPAHLGYGDSGTASGVFPGETLIFRVKLHQVI